MDRADVKARGRKHLREKTHHKNRKYMKEKTQLPLQQQEALPSNHDRYALSESEDETTGADFSLLASAPTSVGGHFRFKGDALQTAQSSIDTSSKYLQNLDGGLLSCSIRTVPFHIRCGIESKYITKEQIGVLCKKAEHNKQLYLNYLENHNAPENKDDISEAMKNVTVTETASRKCGSCNDPEKAELEDWLEDVLND